MTKPIIAYRAWTQHDITTIASLWRVAQLHDHEVGSLPPANHMLWLSPTKKAYKGRVDEYQLGLHACKVPTLVVCSVLVDGTPLLLREPSDPVVRARKEFGNQLGWRADQIYAVGTVEVTGKVIETTFGYRSSQQTIQELWLTQGTFDIPALEDRYQCVVHSSAEPSPITLIDPMEYYHADRQACA